MSLLTLRQAQALAQNPPTSRQLEEWFTPLQLVALEAGLGRSDNRYARYANNPVEFSREVLGTRPTAAQAEVLESVRDHKVTVVMSANAVGKTFIAADVAIWFTRCLERAKVITAAAPPLSNLQRLLWGEIDRRIVEHPEVFQKTLQLHFSFAPDWWCDGVAIPMSGSSAEREAKFAGKHSPFLLFIVDEGDAVPPEVYKGIESCMSGGFVRMLVLFNPREAAGPAYQLIRQGAHVITLDAFSHPNVVSGRDQVVGAVSRPITVERIHKWTRAVLPGEHFAEDDPEYFQVPAYLDGETISLLDGSSSVPLVGGSWRKTTDSQFAYMVLARFPGQAVNQLISRAWVERAQSLWLTRRELQGDRPPQGIVPVSGLDCAEFGPDWNTQIYRYGSWVDYPDKWNGIDPLQTSRKAAEHALERGVSRLMIDAIGIGAGVPAGARDWLETFRVQYLSDDGWIPPQVIGVKVSERPTIIGVDEGDFKTKREQILWTMREWLRTDPTAMLPPSEALAEELCAFRYQFIGKFIVISPKREMRKLLGGRSPDEAEALALTFGFGDNAVPLGFAN